MNDVFNPLGTSESADSEVSQAKVERQRLLRAAMRMGLERPSTTVYSHDETLDAPARAAALLVALGPQLSGQILQRFSPIEAQIASSRLAAVRSVPRDVLIDVLQRFKNITENRSELPFDADSFVSEALGKFEVTNDESEQFVGIRAGLKDKVPFFDVLCTMRADILKQYLSDEHPQLAATVLAILPPDLSAKVLGLFDKTARVDLVRRVATLSPIEGPMIAHLNNWVSDVVRKHLVESKGVEKATIGGVDPVVDLISSFTDKGDREALDELRRSDPDLAAKVEARMFFFEDFALLDNQTLTTFLAAVPPETLEIVLKNESESLQEKFFSCMTQRAANQRRFGMDQLGPMSAEKIEEKRREMISLARSMEKRDLIKLTRNTQGQRQS